MNISKYFMLDEVNIAYGKRELLYFNTGWSYWYNGKEVSQGEYSDKKWKKIKDRFNCGLGYQIENNENYDYEIAINRSERLQKVVKKIIEDKNETKCNN